LGHTRRCGSLAKERNYFKENFGAKSLSIQSKRGFILATLYNEKMSAYIYGCRIIQNLFFSKQ